jgi:hypothetical protein
VDNEIEQLNSQKKRFNQENGRTESSEQARRNALKKMGKYAIYAAPALLAMTSGSKACQVVGSVLEC